MGNGWHEWPLMIFTVLGQCVAGGFIVLTFALLRGRQTDTQRHRIIRTMFGLWVLMGIGFAASMLHLGSPLRAMNSLNRIGSSALSNEIAAGSLFFAVGGLGWLLAVCKKLPLPLYRVWLLITTVLGVVFVWMMGRVYDSIDTVPTWFTLWTSLGFFLTMFTGGSLLGYLLLRLAGYQACAMRGLPVITLLALVASLAVAVMQGIGLGTISSSVAQAASLVPDYGELMAWRAGLLLVALGIWVLPQRRNSLPGLPALSLAFVLLLAGELIGRGVFYGLHMTVGVAVAG